MAGEFRLRSFVVGQLRRVFRRFPPYYRTLGAAKETYYVPTKSGGQRKRVRFKCNVCGKWADQKNISIDHIIPVIPETGFPTNPDGSDDFTTFINRLFCKDENLQAICDECHHTKTQTERKERAAKKLIDKS